MSCKPAIVAWLCVAALALPAMAAAQQVEQTLAREEDRTQQIGDQAQNVARELERIVRELEINRLLTREENADFVAARDGMDEIARKEVGTVLSELIAARRALELAKRTAHLRRTIAAQERLIERLTEELVRIQYRSQLRHLLEQMRRIVADQRQAIRVTQNGAIEMAAAESDALVREIHDRVLMAQDGVWHDWMLVSEQVRVMVERFRRLPFIETLERFHSKAESLPIDEDLARTRDHLHQRRFGLAMSSQERLVASFLELLEILQDSGMSPAEERSALEQLIEKTEQALRRQQELLAQTQTFGRDMTEPLRQELAQAENRLANFVSDLAREAEQVGREAPPEAAPAETGPEQTESAASRAGPKSSPQETVGQQTENPWSEAPESGTEPARSAEPLEPSSPAGRELGKAAQNMVEASDELSQGSSERATDAQRQAVDHLARALSQMHDRVEQALRRDQVDSLAGMFESQQQMLDELGQIIRQQQRLIGATRQVAMAGSTREGAAGQEGAPESDRAEQPDGQADRTGRGGAEPAARSERSTDESAERPAASESALAEPDSSRAARQNGRQPSQGEAESASESAVAQEQQAGTERSGQRQEAGAAQAQESRAAATEPLSGPQQGAERTGGETGPPSPAELGEAQAALEDRTAELAGQIATSPAAQPLSQAVDHMDRAARDLGRARVASALPYQQQALRSLHEAERKLAEMLAEAYDAQQAMEWLGPIGELDQVIGQIDRMAEQAAAMPPQPAPAMAEQAADIADRLGAMVGAPPMGPAMAARMREGSQLMGAASSQLEQGQTAVAAQTMRQAASTLVGVRSQMASQMSASLAQARAGAMARAQAAARSQQAGRTQATGRSMAGPRGTQAATRPATRPSRGGRGKGMRGLGPTDYDAKAELARQLESGEWSRLPQRQREEILQALKERYPARYERALIRYYRNLSRLEGKR